MDQHPIPQNVTGFQFKLIGSMTVKQFGYVASGVVMAVIIYYLPLAGTLSFLLKTILIPIFGSIGAIVAFVPFDGRPIDVMIGNFVQALFSPNQYIYRKSVKSFSFSTISLSRPHPMLQKNQIHHTTPKQNIINKRGAELQRLLVKNEAHKIKNDLDAREEAYLSNLSTPALMTPSTSIPMQNKPIPTSGSSTPTPSDLTNKEEALEKQLESAKQEEIAPHNTQDLTKVHQKVLDLQRQIQETNDEKKLLEKEIMALKNQLPKPSINQVPSSITKPQAVRKPAPVQVRSVAKEMNKTSGVLASDTPNVVTGIVKDARGNVLQNILVEIKDQKGNPVRAFKTNSLGNFASATPLAPGTYTITLEDLKKQQTFDPIQITTNNQIMAPLEITSYDNREELRKELFN